MTSQKKVRVRFAPSPTGYLHIGGARSALFNYLFARKHGGDFLLRIEDTDRSRFVEGALTEIYDSLRWLGLDWDEGPQKGGECGPYTQSERLHIYSKYAKELLESGHAYRCFCTSERLTALRESQEKSGGLTGYDRHCRDLSAHEIEQNLNEKIPFVIRLKIPADRTVSFEDLIRGHIEYKSEALDDIVLMKADGFPTYHMANVVDDHEMKITHVLRGDEWITSTPRHCLLYEAFGWEAPAFAHLPVILSPDGGKLSKRKGAASVMDYKRGGFLPDALFNFLAFLGWNPGDDREKMTREELIAAFSLDNVSPKAAVLDEKKLEWVNGLYMAETSVSSLAKEVVPMWKEKGWVSADTVEDDSYLMKVVDLMKVRSKRITELAETAVYFFVDPAEYEEKAVKKNFSPQAAARLSLLMKELESTADFTHPKLDELFRTLAESQSLKTGDFIHPVRLAISGVSFGPGLFELMEVLGKDAVLRRITRAVEFINNIQK